jgi:Cytochrome P460
LAFSTTRSSTLTADKRNGEWEYRAFKADKTPNEQINLGVCFDCHRPQAKQDYVHSYDNLKTATP